MHASWLRRRDGQRVARQTLVNYTTCMSQSAARWKIIDGKIAIESSPDDQWFPNSIQVFRAVYLNDLNLGVITVSCSPVIDLPQLSFSRFPAEIAVLINRDTIGFHQLKLVASTDDGDVEVGPAEEQLIHRNRWYPIRAADLRDAHEWLSGFGVAVGRPITLGQVMALRAVVEPRFPVRFANANDAGTIAVELAGPMVLDDSFPLPLPADVHLAVIPYSYQRAGIAYLRYVAAQDIGCILADEMGLGKTLQIIGLLESERCAGRGPSLVLTLSTLLENWRREIVRCAPNINVLVHAGPDRAGIAGHLLRAGIVVCSFDTALRDEVILGQIEWNVLVLDEAQAIRNPSSQRTISIKRLRRRVSIAVTGTPVQNRLEDLWSITDYAIPGVLGSLADFRTLFPAGSEDASQVAKLVSPIMLRRTVDSVASDLPERIDIPQAIPLSQSLARQYEQIRQEILLQGGAAAGLVAVTRLRKFCAHPSLVDKKLISCDPSDGVERYQRLIEIIDNALELNAKIIVFAPFRQLIDLLACDLQSRWPSAFVERLDGRVPSDERQEVVDRYSEFDGSAILVMNPRAVGAGLNITAANHVIHFCPEWNPAVTDQASARAHRRGQTRPVTVHYLFCADTIEEVMHERAGDKRDLADQVVRENDGMLTVTLIERALAISPVRSKSGDS